MTEAENQIQKLIENINILKISLQEENPNSEESLEIFVEKVSTLFKKLKVLPHESTLQYESQMYEYCIYLNQIIETLQMQQITIKEEIGLLNQKMKAYKLYTQ